MAVVASVAYLACLIFYLALLLRIGIEMIQSYAPAFRPRGAVLVACELIFTVTDPPVKALRKLIPPLRLGSVALDVSILVIFVAVTILLNILVPFVL